MKSVKFLYILAGLFGTFVNCYNMMNLLRKSLTLGYEVRNNYSICMNDCIVF